MTTADAVIGAGFGDEGKGLLVDFLSSQTNDATVVRSNGGAQAGHTVTTPDGRRHIFHHIGSGALTGAKTHLSQFFVANPLMFLKERDRINELNGVTTTSTDPRSLITTPFDVLINQATETTRSGARHGSCGMGFGETIERHENGFTLTAIDLMKPTLRQKITSIRDVWLPKRLEQLGISKLPDHLAHIPELDSVIEHFLDECEAYNTLTRIVPDGDLVQHGPIIFEGAQGLLLDMDYGTFPHVTRSHTGAQNMGKIACEAGIDRIHATYVTRCYATRHGAGPFKNEQDCLRNITVKDPTNIANAWQGALRLANLDVHTLDAAIKHDVATTAGVAISPKLGVTCLDQASAHIDLEIAGTRSAYAPEILARNLASELGIPLFAESWGPTRDTIKP